jgi:hypothetical protein
MAYLGHKKGPRMSVILERYRSELLLVTKCGQIGGPVISSDVVDNLIEKEKRSEDEGIWEVVNYPKGPGVKDDEMLFIGIDLKTGTGVQFYYVLTAEEERMLGKTYNSKKVQVVSQPEFLRQSRLHEEIMAAGETFWGSNE